jgi:hypothetical protein
MDGSRVGEIIFTNPLTPLMLRPELAGEMADEALYGMTASVIGEEKIGRAHV